MKQNNLKIVKKDTSDPIKELSLIAKQYVDRNNYAMILQATCLNYMAGYGDQKFTQTLKQLSKNYINFLLGAKND